MLRVDFLNVGKGNCTVIKFPSDHLSVVDIDNSRIDDKDDVLQDPIEFLNTVYPRENIFRFILSHPDMDHMSGIDKLFRTRSVFNFWDTEHDKSLDVDSDEFGPYDPNDWRCYQGIRGSDRSFRDK